MLPNDLVSVLTSDATLTTLIGAGHVFPTETTYLGDCVLYDWYINGHDGVVVTSRLEVTVIAGTLALSLEIERRIDALLITLGDRQHIQGILRAVRNGGGVIRDADRKKYHRYLYYDIISKGA